MATLKEIRKRISSVKNTQKVTKTMKMIAAARLRKAQMHALNARNYTEHLNEMAHHIASRTSEGSHPLFHRPDMLGQVDLLVLTSDRGLCGGFNENLLRDVANYYHTNTGHGVQFYIWMFGKKGRDYFKSRHLPLDSTEVGFYEKLTMTKVRPIADKLIERFIHGETSQVTVAYNRFKSAVSQEVVIETILPFEKAESDHYGIDYICEPSEGAVLDQIVRRSIYTRLYQMFLESIASELAARMSAMDNATRNASELLGSLTMLYNRARQASITKDLMDIVNGAESLKK